MILPGGYKGWWTDRLMVLSQGWMLMALGDPGVWAICSKLVEDIDFGAWFGIDVIFEIIDFDFDKLNTSLKKGYNFQIESQKMFKFSEFGKFQILLYFLQ